MTTVIELAKYFRKRYAEERGYQLNDWVAQKLCYYAQAWHLVWTGKPLFTEQIQAWSGGPVAPELYRAQKYDPDLLAGESAIDGLERVVADRVFETYGHESGQRLSELTHREDPWRDARGNAAPGDRTNEEIPREAIKAYFERLAEDLSVPNGEETFEETLKKTSRQYAEVLRRLA